MSINSSSYQTNSLNINGSMYIDNVVFNQNTSLNTSISSVSTSLNNISIQPVASYTPSQPITTYTILSSGLPFSYTSFYQFPSGTPLFYVICSDACTQNQGLITLANYDTFSGYDSATNHVFVARDTIHQTICNTISSPSFYASYLQPDVTLGVYGVSFTYAFATATNFNGVNLFFPTSNTPVWMFILTSSDLTTWSELIVPKQYTGSGNEIYNWTFNNDFTTQANYYRLVVASASNTSFDFGGCQWIQNPSSVGLGNSLYPCNLTGMALLFNSHPWAMCGGAVSDETTTLTTTNTLTFRCPITFRVTMNKMPVFSLTNAPAGANLVLNITQNGASIYGGSGAGSTATISTGSLSSGSTYSTTVSSCGLFFGTNSDGSRTFNEGDIIRAYVSSFSGTNASGLKVTIYNS